MPPLRSAWFIIACAAVALSLLAPGARAQEEPVIQGRNAAEWAAILEKDESPRRRQGAAIALGLIGSRSRDVLPALTRALRDDKDENVRRRVVAALGQLREEDPEPVVRALADALKTDPSPAIRAAAATALGRFGADARPALGALTSALKDESPAIRAAAAEAIGHLGTGTAAVPDLTALLKDADKTVRLYAVFALGRIGPDAAPAVPALAERLRKDETEDVRRAAAKSLGLLGALAAEGAPALAEALLQDADRAVRQEAVLALTRMGPGTPEAQDALRKAMSEDKDKSVRSFAVHGLMVVLGDDAKSAVPALAERLGKEEVGEVKLVIIQELGALGSDAEAAVPALKAAQRDVQKIVREAATAALKKIQAKQ